MKRILPIAGIMVVFLLTAFLLIKIYDKGKEQKPLRYADIPQETIDWIESLGNGFGDILAGFNPNPIPTPWDNEGDFGQDSLSGLKTLEDDYFIFYFPESLTNKAKLCQQLAHESIPRMEDIVGKYYYPEDMNGRKVPIYLTPDQKSFESLMEKLFKSRQDYSSTGGVTISSISPSGYYLVAIALNGHFSFQSPKDTKEILWHELTHYCFFASIDYNYYVNLPMWCYEGIAEYTAKQERPSFTHHEITMMQEDCHFTDPYFPYVFENYEGGQSIFCHMEDRYHVDGVKRFLRSLYTQGLQTSLKDNFSTTIPQFENNWKANLEKFR